jgi:hypothetical protein
MTDTGRFKFRPNRAADVQQRSDDASLMGRPFIAWILAFGSVSIGAVLSVWPVEIREATKRAIFGPRGALEVWVSLFWLVCGFWSYVLYRRLKSDHQTEDERVADVLRAIHRAPNYEVVKNYPEYFRRAADAISLTAEATGSPEEKLRALETGLQVVLTLVTGMTQEFARASDNSSYGANIMLVARPDLTAPSAFDRKLLDKLRFYDRVGGNAASLFAVLYLPETLLLSNAKDRAHRDIPLISLPVPSSTKNEMGNRLALPGAPWALLTGTQSVEEDTREMASECADFAKPIISEIDRYFSEEGDGRHVRSFVSYRIGDENAPIGVLNIDCNRTNVLGPEPEYHPTFYALITPLIRLLRKSVFQYAQLSASQGYYFDGATGQHPVVPGGRSGSQPNGASAPAVPPGA